MRLARAIMYRMGGANLEVIRECVTAFERGDVSVFLQRLHPEAEWCPPPQWRQGLVYRGREAIEEGLAKWIQSFPHLQFQLEELLDAGEQVVVLARNRPRNLQSAGEGWEIGLVYTLTEGRIVRIESYLEWRPALVAAGLPPTGEL